MTELNITDACSILVDAADAITERGHQRDQPNGERSMARAVHAFNAMHGTELTEHQGWQFMVMLKMSRSTGSALRIDDYTDGAAYFALAGESAARAQAVGLQAIRDQDATQTSIDIVNRLMVERRANGRRTP